jgi:lipopolysaccharide transport system permease protein
MSITLEAGHEHSIELLANLTPDGRRRVAWQDLREGFAMRRLAMTLGWLDIKLRYRGSVLGPFWLTLSTAVMVLAMGVLYSQLFRMQLHDYMPYLALSLVLWNALNGIVSDACVCFTSAEGTIRSVRMPFMVYAERALVRNALVLAHNVVVIVGVMAYYSYWPGAAALACLPGLLLWVVDAVAACFLLGAFCARYRDIPPIVASIMQIAFFLTPIIWRAELIGPKARFLVLNPFFSLMSVVREPLLNQIPGWPVWVSAFVWSGLLCVAAWLLFARVRGRLAFWV